MENIEFWNAFPIEDNVHIATPLLNSDFENNYIKIRVKEGRLYSDEIVKCLPEIPSSHEHYYEWKCRRFASDLLKKYLSKNEPKKILDLGCGNGWFSNKLYQSTNAVVIGLDINKTELKQAATLFSNESCKFVLGDIFEEILPEKYFDCILLNASIQYFPSIPILLRRLNQLLIPGGEIHILNSPIYKNKNKASQARLRSSAYFNSIASPGQINYYHHHIGNDFSTADYQVLYESNSFFSYFSRKILRKGSPFPWICIKHNPVNIVNSSKNK